ncbi:MAG: AIR synthase [Firmicutes bacterium]|nr:AIR synthase [Bacillota bacterium]
MDRTVKAGKLSPEKLRSLIFERLHRRRSDILLRPGLGEDSAVIDFGEEVCVISTDPITGASRRLGWLAVHVACNDVAANGAEPVGIQAALLLPEGIDDEFVGQLIDDMDSACGELGIEILGGHTEVTSQVNGPLVVATAVGRAPRDLYVTSAGAQPGDVIYVTKGVGFEGTAILAADHREALVGLGVEEPVLDRADGFFNRISVVQEALAAAKAGASAMHDITEGGFYGALWELLGASGWGCEVTLDSVPVLPETKAICDALKLDPLGLISSGSLLITAPPEIPIVEAAAQVGVKAYPVGRITSEDKPMLIEPSGKSRELSLPEEDELWRFLAGK